VGEGGIIPADRSIATANARERRRIPRFMLDTFGWRGRLAGEAHDRSETGERSCCDLDYPGWGGSPIKKFSSDIREMPMSGSFGEA